jgi:hypothetical protein
MIDIFKVINEAGKKEVTLKFKKNSMTADIYGNQLEAQILGTRLNNENLNISRLYVYNEYITLEEILFEDIDSVVIPAVC